MSSSESLFWLKYEGVPSYEDIYKNKKYIAFKCKKYAYWDQVHSSEDSKSRLIKAHSLLVDDDSLETDLFEEIQLTWEKLQRWKKDKEHLSIEPNKLKEFIRLESLCLAGCSNPSYVATQLQKFQIEVLDDDPDVIWLLYLSLMLSEFFNSIKVAEVLGRLEFDINAASNDVIAIVDEYISNLYEHLSYEVADSDSFSNVFTLLDDLGIPYEKKWEFIDINQVQNESGNVFISQQELDLSQFISFIINKGDVTIQINTKHPLFNKIDLTDNLSNYVLQSLGQAVLDNLADLDKVQDFLYALGSRLRINSQHVGKTNGKRR